MIQVYANNSLECSIFTEAPSKFFNHSKCVELNSFNSDIVNKKLKLEKLERQWYLNRRFEKIYDNEVVLCSTDIDELLKFVASSISIKVDKPKFVEASIPIKGNKPTLTKKTKVFFSETCSFPSLLLADLNQGAKRTTKIESATYIVTDLKSVNFDSRLAIVSDIPEKPGKDLQEFYGLQYIILDNINSTTHEYLKERTEVAKNIQDILKQQYNADSYFCIKMSREQYILYSFYLQKNNIVNTYELINTLYQSMPLITDDDCSNLISAVCSSDREAALTGYKMFQYYNISEKIPDILSAIVKKHIYIPNTVSANYLCYILGIDSQLYKRLTALNFDTDRQIHLFIPIFLNNPLMINQELRNKVRNVLRKNIFDEINEKYEEVFAQLDISLQFNYTENAIIDDSNGEAKDSNREMETE